MMALALFSAASKIFQVFRFLATIFPPHTDKGKQGCPNILELVLPMNPRYRCTDEMKQNLAVLLMNFEHQHLKSDPGMHCLEPKT